VNSHHTLFRSGLFSGHSLGAGIQRPVNPHQAEICGCFATLNLRFLNEFYTNMQLAQRKKDEKL